MSKKSVFEKIKNLHFIDDVQPLLQLIGDNLDRVEFVKDHIGLSNFIFLAEREATEFDFPYYACFEVDIKRENEMDDFLAMNRAMVYDTKEIENKIKSFLREQKDTLYVEIGFKESIPSQEDHFRTYQLLKSGKATDIPEAIAMVRRFPEWYEAKHSKEIQKEKDMMKKLEIADKVLTKKLKKDLMEEIDNSLKNNDYERFKSLAEKYKKATLET